MHLTGEGSFIAQGYTPDHIPNTLHPGESAVELPLSLVPELAFRPVSRDLWLTKFGTVIVIGRKLADPAALMELALPPNEDAVIVERSRLPELAEVNRC